MSQPNTFGLLLPKPASPAALSTQSANPPMPLQNAADAVATVQAVADVAAEALAIHNPDAAAIANAAAELIALADMIPGTAGPKPPSKKTVHAFSGSSNGGFDGGQVDGHGVCLPCKVAALVGMPVNAVLGIKVLSADTETDFTLDAPLPLIWQRQYFSDVAQTSWLGQGWTLPFSITLNQTPDGWLYTDEQGRNIPLPNRFDDEYQHFNVYAADTHQQQTDETDETETANEHHEHNMDDAADVFFDPYEQIAFSRLDTHRYQIASADGSSRLIFAPFNPGDALYRLVAIMDNNGNHHRIIYDETGLPHTLYDSANRAFRLLFGDIPLTTTDPEFDACAQTGAFVSKDGLPYVRRLIGVAIAGSTQLVRYDYNAHGDLAAVYGADGKLLRTFAYRNHIMIEHSQPNGLTAQYQYNQYTPNGKVLHSQTNLGQSWTFDYRAGHTIVTDALGRSQTYGFDDNRELIYQIDANGNRSDTERDDYGRIILVRDSLGRQTRYLYDYYGNLLAVTAPDGSRSQIHYEDERHPALPTQIVQSDGSNTDYAYDERGNLISQSNALGHTTHYQYNPQGQITQITDPLGKSQTLTYNAAGQTTAHSDCSGYTTHFSYTPLGNIERITDAKGQTTQYHYDAASNLLRTDYPDGSSEQFHYDHLNRLIAHTDPLGHTTQYQLNADGLPHSRINAEGHQFAYHYDTARRLIRLTNENGEHYHLAYDKADQLIQEIGWDGKVNAYAYDAAGQLRQHTEYGCQTPSTHAGSPNPTPPTLYRIHHYHRNLLGQLTEKHSTDFTQSRINPSKPITQRTRFDYDPMGIIGSHRLIRARNQHSSITFTYDAIGQITQETLIHKGHHSTTTFSYDANGNRIQTQLPNGQTLNQLYYGSGHLHHINLDGQTIADIERNELHQESQRTQGDLISQFEFDPMGRLRQHSTHKKPNYTQPNNPPLIHRRYSYDKAGNLTHSSDNRSGTSQYIYDKIGRILKASHTHKNHTEIFAFDPASNILDTHSPHPIKGNRIHSFEGTTYTYNELGNIIYRELPNGESQYYQYDTENQLSQVQIKKTDGTTQQWQYAYDPFGRRISKERTDKGSLHSTDPKLTLFIWDGTKLLQEYTYKGAYTYVYTDQDNYKPLAHVFHNNKDAQLYLSYYHTDQIGIPREQTDQFGNLLWLGDYTAWGSLKTEQKIYPNAHQPFRLQNQYCDQETGLHYNLFRYYDPLSGRFMTQDPITILGGYNLYFYSPNTQMWLDPWGLKGITVKSAPAGSPFTHYMVISASEYPETAQHIKEAINCKGKASVVTYNPTGSSKRRKKALKGTKCKKGKDRDEWPMAIFEEGGEGSSIKHITPKDNRGAGSSINHALKSAQIQPNEKVKIFIQGGKPINCK